MKENLRFKQSRLNYINKQKNNNMKLIKDSFEVGVFAKTDDEIFVLSIMKIFNYFSLVYSILPKKIELLKISKVM